MRILAVAMFVGATLAVASLSTAQPPEGGKGGKGGQGGKGGDGKGFPGGKGGGFGVGGGLGQVMPVFVQDQLKLTDSQKKDLEALQKDVDAKIEKMLTDDQKKAYKEMKERGPGRGPGGFPGGPGGAGGFPGGPGGGPGGNPPPKKE
jgi:hypothetical protein